MILVTGSSGLLGWEIKKQLDNVPALYPTRQELDVTDPDAIKTYIDGKEISLIINCAANVNAEFLEDNEEYAQKITVLAPKYLAEISSVIGAGFVHISTDYVFDGTKNTPYVETDQTNALSIYGKKKIEGEIAVLENAKTCAIIRTAWLFSEQGRDFIDTIRRVSATRKEINVVYDQVGSPSYIPDLAKMVITVGLNMAPGTREIYHATNEGVCSWYDIAHMIVSELDLDCKVKPIRSYEYPLKAERPHYSVLDKGKIKKHFGIEIRHYSDALKECLSNIKNGRNEI